MNGNVSLLEAFALALVNQNLYGLGHRISRDATESAWEALRSHLQHQGAIAIGLRDDELLFNGQLVPCSRAALRHMSAQLSAFQIQNLRIAPQCRREDFNGLLVVLNAPKPASASGPPDLTARLAKAGIQHVAASRAVYRRTDEADLPPMAKGDSGKTARADDSLDTESEVAEFLKQFQAAKAVIAPTTPPETPKPEPEPVPQPSPPVEPAPEKQVPAEPPETGKTETMAAFLAGEDRPEAKAALGEAADGRAKDISAMVSLLIAAIMMRKQQEQLTGDDFVALISQSLRRSFDAVQQTVGDAKSAKCIRGVQQGIGKWLSSQGETLDPAAADAEAAADAISRETLESLEIRRTIEGYVSQRRQLSTWEKRLSALMRKQGPLIQEQSLLKTALESAGLPPNNWESVNLPADMLGAQGLAPTPAPADPPQDAALNAMLATLTFACSGGDDGNGPGGAPPDFEQDLKRIREEIDSLIAHTTAKIERLADTIQNLRPDDGPDNFEKPKSLVDLMAEAVQELMQPLAVVNSSIDILGGAVGERLNPAQRRATLDLAAENSRRLQALIEKIGSVAGVPGDLAPHKDWLNLPNETLRSLV